MNADQMSARNRVWFQRTVTFTEQVVIDVPPHLSAAEAIRKAEAYVEACVALDRPLSWQAVEGSVNRALPTVVNPPAL